MPEDEDPQEEETEETEETVPAGITSEVFRDMTKGGLDGRRRPSIVPPRHRR